MGGILACRPAPIYAGGWEGRGEGEVSAILMWILCCE